MTARNLESTERPLPLLKLWGLALLFAASIDCATALEFGHVRARERGWVDMSRAEERQAPSKDADEASPDEAAEVVVETLAPVADDPISVAEEPVPVADAPVTPEPAPTTPQALASSEVSEAEKPIEPVRTGWRKGLRLFRSRDQVSQLTRSGYLASGPPNALRFSDSEEASRRPPSPALPEFTIASEDYLPYLIETPLAEGSLNSGMIDEIVIELETHSVVSGTIDTSRVDSVEPVEHFNLEENHSTVLRPEEVLIYFENNDGKTEANTFIPFSPATPATQTIKSSATLNEE